jgi:hypothetical protein
MDFSTLLTAHSMFTITSAHPLPQLHKPAPTSYPQLKSLASQVEDWLRTQPSHSSLTLPGLSYNQVEALEEEIQSKGLHFK